MEYRAYDAMQRAALTALIAAFHDACNKGDLWRMAAKLPESWTNEHGTWHLVADSSIRTLALDFANTRLGSFAMTDQHGSLESWIWGALKTTSVPQYWRLSGGPFKEVGKGSTPGPLPADLFEMAWDAAYNAFYSFVWANELKPSGLALTLFPLK